MIRLITTIQNRVVLRMLVGEIAPMIFFFPAFGYCVLVEGLRAQYLIFNINRIWKDWKKDEQPNSPGKAAGGRGKHD